MIPQATSIMGATTTVETTMAVAVATTTTVAVAATIMAGAASRDVNHVLAH
jgi:hypothetical protein